MPEAKQIDPQSQMKSKKVAYLLKRYPRISETFILNEILELERQGLDLSIYSLFPPEGGRFHPQVGLVKAPVTYLPQPSLKDFWGWLKKSRAELGNFSPTWEKALELNLEYDQDSKGYVYFLQALMLAQLFQKNKIQHTHAHFATLASYMALSVHLLTEIPYSFTAHAKDIYIDDVDHSLLARKIERAKFVVTVSDFNQKYLSNLFQGRFDHKVLRIYNGLNSEIFKEDNLPREPNLILSVGRLIPKKGFEYLIHACRILKEKGFDFRCQIIGEGGHRQILEQESKARGVDDRVEFLGSKTQDEVIHWMKRSTLLCLPCIVADNGDRDALPTVLLEAMACCLPVVSTRVTGIPEIVEDGQEGLLVEEKDVMALSQAIACLLVNPDIREEFSKNGLLKVKERFSIHENVSHLKRAFLTKIRTSMGSAT